MKEKICGLIVTYNRKEKLEKCIKCLLEQSVRLDKIYIVNNASTDDTEKYLQKICSENSHIFYKSLKENMGGAGGFKYGLKWAYEEGADWIWGMDDDAYAKRDALAELIRAKNIYGNSTAYWSNCNGVFEEKKKYMQVYEWMFVGFLISRKMIESVGYPRADYFIYFDDIEYSYRIIKKGYKIYKVKDSIIEHKDAIKKTKIIYVCNQKIEVTGLPDPSWKAYYFIRNKILMCQDYKEKKKAIRRGIRHLVKAVIFDCKKARFVFWGLCHGIQGKSGKVVAP